jgi:GT2 family glycosyltransferase
MIELSFIIVSWNAKSYLQKCVESIISKSGTCEKEIIVVDNASTDGSDELIREKYQQVVLIRNEANLGFAKANNIGIRRSRGKYVLLVNSDVEVLEGCIEHLILFMEQHPEIGMLGPQIIDANGNLQRSCMAFPTLWNAFCRALALDTIFPKVKIFGGNLMAFWQHDTVREVDVINGCFWLVRREALNQVGLLDERFFIYAEDIDWCKRFWNAGWKVVFVPQAQSVHYGGASSSQAPVRFSVEMHRANLQYWKKHHGRAAQAGFLTITGLHHMIRLMGGLMLYTIKPEKRTSAAIKIKRSVACIQWLCKFPLVKETQL